MRLPSTEIIFQLLFAFFWGPMALFMGPPNSVKCRFLGKFGSHSIIHIFTNYFVIVFLAINFQFSANKWYPNRSVQISRLSYKITNGNPVVLPT